jgi:hypothetical protein
MSQVGYSTNLLDLNGAVSDELPPSPPVLRRSTAEYPFPQTMSLVEHNKREQSKVSKKRKLPSKTPATPPSSPTLMSGQEVMTDVEDEVKVWSKPPTYKALRSADIDLKTKLLLLQQSGILLRCAYPLFHDAVGFYFIVQSGGAWNGASLRRVAELVKTHRELTCDLDREYFQVDIKNDGGNDLRKVPINGMKFKSSTSGTRRNALVHFLAFVIPDFDVETDAKPALFKSFGWGANTAKVMIGELKMLRDREDLSKS